MEGEPSGPIEAHGRGRGQPRKSKDERAVPVGVTLYRPVIEKLNQVSDALRKLGQPYGKSMAVRQAVMDFDINSLYGQLTSRQVYQLLDESGHPLALYASEASARLACVEHRNLGRITRIVAVSVQP